MKVCGIEMHYYSMEWISFTASALGATSMARASSDRLEQLGLQIR